MTLKLPPQPEHCELCERPVPQLTRHHLIPRSTPLDIRMYRYGAESLLCVNIGTYRPLGSLQGARPRAARVGFHLLTLSRITECQR